MLRSAIASMDERLDADRSDDVIAGMDRTFRIRLNRSRAFRNALRVKRVFDVIGALLAIVFLLPVIVVTALSVKLTSPGPVLFTATRWGYRGRHFTCYKFRTMRINQAELLAAAGLEASKTIDRALVHDRDPRITKVGAFLRATSIDELPQLWNVVVGDMSLVGPRPLALPMLEQHHAFREARGLVRPGLSGLWQVTERRKNVEAFDMMRQDLAYLATISLWLDLRILYRTPMRLVLK